MLWFWIAYVVVTTVGIGHTVFNWKILGMTDEGVTITSVYDVSSGRAPLPWHPLYNILLFPPAAVAYFAIVVDVIGWVLIRHAQAAGDLSLVASPAGLGIPAVGEDHGQYRQATVLGGARYGEIRRIALGG